MEKLIEYIKTHKGYKLKTIERQFLTDEVKNILIQHKLTLVELCYRITHDIEISLVPTCKQCGKPLKFTQKHGYGQFCDFKCSGKYSTTNEESVQKRTETNVNRYGVTCVLHNPEVHAKVVEGWKKKYGTDSPNKSEIVKKKKADALEERFGVRSLSEIPGIQEKKEQTSIEHFGTKSPMQSPVIRKKVEETCLKKLGVKCSLQSPKVRKKIEQTLIQKHGVKCAAQIHITNKECLNEDYVKQNFIKDGYFYIKDFCEFFNLKYEIVQRYYKVLFNITEPNKSYKLQRQIEVYEYIKSIYPGEVQLNTHKIIAPQELDIYIPEKHLAIEFDGIMYHSFGKSNVAYWDNADEEDPKYHLKKTEECNKLNIQLLHIFENEWVEKEAIWKSMLAAKLGVTKTKIYARKCEIKPVDKASAYEFLKINHLQGSCSSNINLGLYYNNELVSLMTFGKSRFTDKYTYELLRFCNKLNTVVVGGASKLLKFFRSIYSGSIISYANRRWSDGELYKALGFNYLHSTNPNYYYFKVNTYKLYSRINFQKYKLKKKLEVYDKTLTETENMYNNGYRKIYDCGNLVFTMA